MPALEIRDLTVEYVSGGYVVRPLSAFDLEAEDGELVVLVGPSGSGKTTLLSCIGAILEPKAGEIVVGGTAVHGLDDDELDDYRRKGVGICFQAFNLIASLTAQENVAVPLLISGVKRRDALARAAAMLERVGLGDRARHRPADLSGGQQQRVAIARGLIQDPPVLLADEPTANLDYIQAESIIRLLRDLAVPGRLIIVSTHDHRIVPIADRVVELAPDFGGDQAPPREERFAAGAIIFEEGSRGGSVYVVDEGEGEIIREREGGIDEVVAVMEPGRYFGELGPLLGFPRSATARALTDVVVTVYGLRDFKTEVLGQPDRRED